MVEVVNFKLYCCFRQAWQSLGEMPREKAMAEFVIMVKTLSPLFVPYIKAHLAEKEELEQKK